MRATRFLSLAAAVASLAVAAPSRAADADAAREWVGRYCTRPGCSDAERSPAAMAAGFGAAALAAGLVARRRNLGVGG